MLIYAPQEAWGSWAAVRAALSWGVANGHMESESGPMLGGPGPSLLIHPGHSKGQRASLTPTFPENPEWGSTSGSRCRGPHAERLLETRCLQEARALPPAPPARPLQMSTEEFNPGQVGLSQGPAPPPLADKILNCLRC